MNMVNAIDSALNTKFTENGAVAYKSTLNAVLDLFALGGSYRQRSDADVWSLFEKAFCEDNALAMKCLFWIRDCRCGGAGERRFFRVAMNGLANKYPDVVRRNLPYFSEYGRWDDVYCLVGTQLEKDALRLIADQLIKDFQNPYPTLCAKWAPSENASSKTTKHLAEITRKFMGLTSREYRKMLTEIRSRLNLIETYLSNKEYDEIDFSAVPSQAGIKYSKCFSTKPELAERYREFIKKPDSKVNASVLFPYEIARKANDFFYNTIGSTRRLAIDKYWNAMPDYVADNPNANNIMVVCDTSGSMTWSEHNNVRPIDVAVSLAVYFAERAKGPFHDRFISFASRPQFINIVGRDITEKFFNIRKTALCDSTNLEAVFDLLLGIAKHGDVPAEDFVKSLMIISDMEINEATGFCISQSSIESTMERIRRKWERSTNIPFPHLIYWNANARKDTILDLGPNVSYVSGASPAIVKQIMSGKTGWDLCLETLLSDRYKVIH